MTLLGFMMTIKDRKTEAMMKYKVLITTSGVGSRLGNLTNFTNKCLIRIGDKPAISHIIEKYEANTEFVITLGYYGDHVRQFLNLCYPEHNFTFVEVKNYEGPGSSLCLSILSAKEFLQTPFIFNACDTIVGNSDTIPTPDHNYCAGSQKENTSQYTTLLLDGNRVTKINKKGSLNFDVPYMGICGIKDYESFWNILENFYNLNKNDQTIFEGDIINEMIKTSSFRFQG